MSAGPRNEPALAMEPVTVPSPNASGGVNRRVEQNAVALRFGARGQLDQLANVARGAGREDGAALQERRCRL